ncbi:Uncharacterised protein [Vibrio cholerae]|nr:Uncharacterised protein [Vibrio cholerae]
MPCTPDHNTRLACNTSCSERKGAITFSRSSNMLVMLLMR